MTIFLMKRAEKAKAVFCCGVYFWTIVCLLILSVEDVEDAYIIGIDILLIGARSVLIYHKIQGTWPASLEMGKWPAMLDGLWLVINTQTQAMSEVNRCLNAIPETLCKWDSNLFPKQP